MSERKSGLESVALTLGTKAPRSAVLWTPRWSGVVSRGSCSSREGSENYGRHRADPRLRIANFHCEHSYMSARKSSVPTSNPARMNLDPRQSRVRAATAPAPESHENQRAKNEAPQAAGRRASRADSVAETLVRLPEPPFPAFCVFWGGTARFDSRQPPKGLERATELKPRALSTWQTRTSKKPQARRRRQGGQNATWSPEHAVNPAMTCIALKTGENTGLRRTRSQKATSVLVSAAFSQTQRTACKNTKVQR